jgi:RecA-family ATPase
VATGGVVFGKYPTVQGPVLYLALEDGERRAKKRLTDQMRAAGMTEPPADFDLQYWEAPRVGNGLEEKLHEWLDAHPGAKLIVIDILEKIRPLRTKGGSVYADDYAAVISLQRLAQERGIAIVIVHHVNKAKAEEFRTTPSGAESLLGAVDTLWSLRRIADET